MDSFILNQLLKEFPFRKEYIQNTIKLLEEGNTIPFVARYRKEWTGKLDEVQLREINDRYDYLVDIQNRKAVILNSISKMGKLTPEVQSKIESCLIKRDLEEIYLPYRPKRRTKATEAKEKGVGPLADIIMAQEIMDSSLDEIALPFLNKEKGIINTEQVYKEVGYICSEMIAENADLRKFVRDLTMEKGYVFSKVKREYEGASTKYNMYYNYQESAKMIASHRLLAISRGQKEGILTAQILAPVDEIIEGLIVRVIKDCDSIFSPLLLRYIEDAYKRLMSESIEKQIWNELKEKSDGPAISIFAKNLKDLLVLPPIPGKTVMGIDPGQRTGCKVVVIDSTGKFLGSITIFPHSPVNKKGEAMALIMDMIDNFGVEYIAIGNGTASRETEIFIKDLLIEWARDGAPWEVKHVVVNESGASVYSASYIAREEFPDLDVTIRGAISIARRLQDPLAELVKIDPKSIGVGQYQHDVDQKILKKALDGVVESCVNYVGVDLNTASQSLLQYVSGIGTQLAKNIVAYREEKGPFKNRQQLIDIPKLGPKAFEQSAGFLRIRDGDQPLDNTAVHPESYSIVEAMCNNLGVEIQQIIGNSKLIDQIDPNEYITEKIGLPTILDIIQELKRPGRDPRGQIQMPKFREDVQSVEDLKLGMVLEGIVTNITDFGIFVDIGIHHDGLVHISQMGDKFVKNPRKLCSVGDVIRVRVISIDVGRKRVSLSMKGL